MLRRFLMIAVAAIFAVTGTTLAVQAPAAAWTDTVSASRYYSTHTGTLYIYATAEGHNWGCSGGGLLMDCADGQNVYAQTSFHDNTYPYVNPSMTRVQSSISFSGNALSVGVPGSAGWSSYGNTCTSPAFDASGGFVSVTTNGVVCHAQTVLSITGMTLWVYGWGKWDGVWDGASTSRFLDMYPR